jgi:hypothetical protein
MNDGAARCRIASEFWVVSGAIMICERLRLNLGLRLDGGISDKILMGHEAFSAHIFLVARPKLMIYGFLIQSRIIEQTISTLLNLMRKECLRNAFTSMSQVDLEVVVLYGIHGGNSNAIKTPSLHHATRNVPLGVQRMPVTLV